MVEMCEDPHTSGLSFPPTRNEPVFDTASKWEARYDPTSNGFVDRKMEEEEFHLGKSRNPNEGSVSGAKIPKYTSGLSKTPTKSYRYDPLPSPRSIRLLEWPSETVPTRELRCKLRVVEIDSVVLPPYSALSYSWGGLAHADETPIDDLSSLLTNTIVCDDGVLRITGNAHDALAELRWRGRAALLWIDGVCIDQSNPAERAQQVAFMGEIYAKAERVIVWLGVDDSDARLAQEVILGRSISHGIGLYSFKDSESFLTLAYPPVILNRLRGVLAFLSRPWFHRLWIIQEVALAKKIWIICGGLQLDWQDFVVFASSEQEISRMTAVEGFQTSADPFLGLFLIRLVSWLRSDRNDLEEAIQTNFGSVHEERRLCDTFGTFLSAFRKARASDPRDRIYAPLSLARETLRTSIFPSLTPDYTQSVEQVYTAASEYLLKQTPSLALLSLVETSQAASTMRSSLLPSWVPDFRVNLQQASILWNSGCDATQHWVYEPCSSK